MVVERLRTGASWLHLVIAAAIVVGVFVQVYLIGAAMLVRGDLRLRRLRSA